MDEHQNAGTQFLMEENQRLKTIIEKTYHFLRRGSINSTWKTESQLFESICKELEKTNHDNIIHLYKISMTQKQIQYYNSQISRMFLGAIVLETYYHPAEFGEERKIDHLLLDFGAKREFPNSRYWADSCLPIHHDFNWLMEALKRALSLRPDIYNIQLSTNIDEVYAQLCRMIDIINEEHEQ